jgi:flavin reductase (DIM6/NTAB) family NADH-FMN oxidoreductase RutF
MTRSWFVVEEQGWAAVHYLVFDTQEKVDNHFRVFGRRDHRRTFCVTSEQEAEHFRKLEEEADALESIAASEEYDF